MGPFPAPSKLYLRIDPDAAQSAVSAGKCTEAEKACTIAISAGEAIFRGANEQGTKALYSEKEGSEGEKLFEVDVNKAIAYEPAASTLVAGKVRGLMGASDDLGRVYLVSSEDRDGAGPAKAGDFNLYLYEAGAGFTFVARLLGTGWKSELRTNDSTSSDVRSISPFPVNRGSRVSGDGLQAAFMSDSPALAEEAASYDNSDANSGEADSEVYLYDAGEGKLRCVSCNPGGGRPEGRPLRHGHEAWTAAQIPGWENQWHASRLLSAGGQRLFFESFEALLARDTNSKQDVYEWERSSGKAQCEEQGAERYVPGSEGCLSLISSGKSAQDSEVLDASASGSDVFFTTVASLIPSDPGLVDIYDARIDGGFEEEGGGEGGECEGVACQNPAPPPAEVTPASAALKGQGNVPEEKRPRSCPKGKRKVRRHGKTRCLSRHKGAPHHKRHHRGRRG